ncbi:hypothetical protein PsAD37_01947 [Pseudovibrio sp. Ad37]|nr:hypothetical protein PsAD37_01947 [Pseudovibrio sp. Ad37]
MSFATDLSLHTRLRNSIKILIRGKGRQLDRIQDIGDQFRPLFQRDFPEHLSARVKSVRQFLFKGQKDVKTPTFKEFTECILELYDANLEARVIATLRSSQPTATQEI